MNTIDELEAAVREKAGSIDGPVRRTWIQFGEVMACAAASSLPGASLGVKRPYWRIWFMVHGKMASRTKAKAALEGSVC